MLFQRKTQLEEEKQKKHADREREEKEFEAESARGVDFLKHGRQVCACESFYDDDDVPFAKYIVLRHYISFLNCLQTVFLLLTCLS